MRTNYGLNFLSETQNNLYCWLNEFSLLNGSIQGRLVAPPVVIASVILQTIKHPIVVAVENAAFAVINLVGCLFSEWYSIRDAWVCSYLAIIHAVTLPVAFGLAPVNLIFEMFLTLWDPIHANPLFSLSDYLSIAENDRVRAFVPPSARGSVVRTLNLRKGVSKKYPNVTVRNVIVQAKKPFRFRLFQP